MIYAIGVDGDYTFSSFVRKAVDEGREVQLINMRAVVLHGSWSVSMNSKFSSWIKVAGDCVILDPKGRYFFRPYLPERYEVSEAVMARWTGLFLGLTAWLRYQGTIVVNRPGHDYTNGMKIAHESLLASMGFQVPDSITTSDPGSLLNFCRGRRVIVKANSGNRANARYLRKDELACCHPRQGPVHAQEYVDGVDLRVHVVGKECFSVRIDSQQDDYRRDADNAGYTEAQPPTSLLKEIIAGSHKLGLILAGWDFKIDDDGQIWCLEANPMPGFGTYDEVLNFAIARALVELLDTKKNTVRGSH